MGRHRRHFHSSPLPRHRKFQCRVQLSVLLWYRRLSLEFPLLWRRSPVLLCWCWNQELSSSARSLLEDCRSAGTPSNSARKKFSAFVETAIGILFPIVLASSQFQVRSFYNKKSLPLCACTSYCILTRIGNWIKRLLALKWNHLNYCKCAWLLRLLLRSINLRNLCQDHLSVSVKDFHSNSVFLQN